MGSALLNPAAHAAGEASEALTAAESPEELRRQVAARLAAHRERRLRKETATAPDSHPVSAQTTPKTRIAAAVAERYSKAQSYRAFLAAEAERAVQQARAAAEVAARNARAVAEAQQQLLESLALPEQTEASEEIAFESFAEQALWPELEEPVSPAEPIPPHAEPALRVVLYDDTPAAALRPVPLPGHQHRSPRYEYGPDPEALALDEEISFRQAPVFEEPAGPPMPLPANLIEFPRQLIAPRKARPRYAEGPLREEEGPTGAAGQLRIFEVESTQIATTAEQPEAAAAAEAQWTSIWLDSPGRKAARPEPAATVEDIAEPGSYIFATPKLYTARVPRRLLAGSIDLAITGLAGLGCAAGTAATTAAVAGQAPWHLHILHAAASAIVHTVPAGTLALTGVAVLVLLSVLLQAVCFTFSEGTPGMRLARIGLCTFSDDNPTRAAMRRRIPALVLSTALFGLGFVWAFLDEDRLTWHDLISRMYQRSY